MSTATARQPRWQPPRLRLAEAEGAEPRRATWVELLYDLVFVVAVAELAGLLADDPGAASALRYAALFVPVWWAWAGQTFYANRFDTDDIAHRLLVVAQIVIVAGLAASVHGALGERSTAFALCYAAVRGVLVLSYLRARRHVAAARTLIDRYLGGFSLSIALWLISVAVPAPWRFAVWAAAMVVDLGTPLLFRKHQAPLPPQPQHLPERFGLFVVIVLGESFAAAVHGLTEQDAGLRAAVAAAAGIALAVGIWWLYFDNLEEGVVLRTAAAGQVWVYSHLLLFMAVAATAVGIESAVVHAQASPAQRWLLCGAVAGTLAVLGVLTACSQGDGRGRHRAAGALAALAVGALSAAWPPALTVAVLATVLLLEVVADMRLPRRAR